MVNGPPKLSDFLDKATAQETVLGRGSQKHGFDVVREGFIGVSHLQFLFKIGKNPQSSQ